MDLTILVVGLILGVGIPLRNKSNQRNIAKIRENKEKMKEIQKFTGKWSWAGAMAASSF